MPQAWVRAVTDLPPASRSAVGVGICVSDPEVFQLHVGVVHRGYTGPARLLHLAFHAFLVDEQLPSDDLHYVWVELNLDSDRAEAVAGLCRRIAKRPPEVPYGLVYEGGSLADDGTAKFAGQEIGFTCSTYVLALLAAAGIRLLELRSWPSRSSDAAWHERVVQMLEDYRRRHPERLTAGHVNKVRSEKVCARFRPEEVAGACSTSAPVQFQEAVEAGRSFVTGFIGLAVVDALLRRLGHTSLFDS